MTSAAIKGIHQAVKARERADKAKREATALLARRCREARRAGVPLSQIAREAGLSRQAVYDLLGQSPAPQG